MLQKYRYSGVTSPVKPRNSQLAKGHFHYLSSQSLIHKVSQTYFPSGEYKSKREALKLNVIFLSLFIYLKIMKINNLRKDTNPRGGGDEGSNTKGSMVLEMGRHPGSTWTTGGRHFKQNQKWTTGSVLF